MITTQPIAALFVRHDSIYKVFPGVDCYDVERDAKKWVGGCPVVAHPPCRAWSALAHMSTAPQSERDLTPWAVEIVRQWGGVLEHPQRSRIWRELPKPWMNDRWGTVIECNQWHWGHVASKPTRLYVCGLSSLPEMPLRSGTPKKTVTGIKGQPGRRCTNIEREATPQDFAAWLVEVARKCRGYQVITESEVNI